MKDPKSILITGATRGIEGTSQEGTSTSPCRMSQRAVLKSIRPRTGSGPWQRVSMLSGGNQQKVALARLLHHDVEVFLLDEPTSCLDPTAGREFIRLLEDLREEIRSGRLDDARLDERVDESAIAAAVDVRLGLGSATP